jgi:DNA-binding transcriptional MocR family regulator
VKAGALVQLMPAWRRDGVTLADGLERAIETAILDGRIARGTRLPSERALAETLGVSRVTVGAAYAALRGDGWIETVRGAGSRAALPAGLDARIDAAEPEADGAIDLARASPMAPLPAYLKALARAGERLGRHAQEPNAGVLPELRCAIAERYARAGLPTQPEQILVTAGAGAGLSLVLRHTLAPGARVLVESPTYPGALELLRAARMRTVGWPVTDGWDPELFAALARELRPAAAYLKLDFHNPTGALASAAQRRQIARAARAAGTTLIVDETMAAFDLRDGGDGAGAAAGAPTVEELVPELPDGTGTLRLSSFAKTVWAGMLVGWVRGPKATIEALAAAPDAYYLVPPTLEQLIAIELLGDFDALVAARRRQLGAQLATLCGLLDGLPELRLTQVPAGGLTTWCELPAGVSSAQLTRCAPDHGLTLLPGSRFSPDGTLDRFLRVPFTLEPATLGEATARLAALLSDPAAQRSARRTRRAGAS